MGGEASVKGVENTGLSLLDIVKHALRTIIQALGQHDYLSVVSFSDSADVLFPLTRMSNAGKALTLSLLDKLQPDACTNLWGGIKRGLEIMHEGNKSRGYIGNSSLFVLTDGTPNVGEPPNKDYALALQGLRERHGGDLAGTIHTFGFGNIDTLTYQGYI